MAVLTGILVDQSPLMDVGNPHLTPAVDQFAVDYWPPHESTVSDGGSNWRINNLPVESVSQEYAGDDAGSYRDDYYYRVHIRPSEIDLGNLISDQVREFEVWNAWFTDQALTSVTPDNAEGLLLTEPMPAPTTFGPLESRLYQLQVSTSGPAVIDAAYTFDFPSDDPVLSVVGTRVIVFPFRPNWKQPVVEGLEWLTDVIESDDGTEQAIALRSAPRRSFEYLLTVSQDDKRRLDVMLWDWQARAFALPIWTDPGRLGAPVSAGDTVLSVATDYLDYHDDGLAILISDTATYEAVEIDTVASGSLALVRGLVNDWPIGTRIYPARIARLQDTQDLDLYTATLEQASVAFSLQDTSTITPAEFNVSTYRGRPVLETRPNWREDISKSFRRKLQQFDNLTGVRAFDDLSGRPVTVQDYLWTRKGRADLYALRQWLYARAGKLVPIWISTYQADLELAADVQDTDTGIKIRHVGYTRHLAQVIGRRDIVIRLRDGTRFYRRITGSLEVDATTEQLAIDAVLGQLVKPSDVQMISWLQLCRLDADKLQLQWHTAEVAECRHYFRGLNDDV